MNSIYIEFTDRHHSRPEWTRGDIAICTRAIQDFFHKLEPSYDLTVEMRGKLVKSILDLGNPAATIQWCCVCADCTGEMIVFFRQQEVTERRRLGVYVRAKKTVLGRWDS